MKIQLGFLYSRAKIYSGKIVLIYISKVSCTVGQESTHIYVLYD